MDKTRIQEQMNYTNKEEYKDIPVSRLNLSGRSFNLLKRNHVDNLYDAIEKAGSLEGLRGIGGKTLDEIYDAIDRSITAIEGRGDMQPPASEPATTPEPQPAVEPEPDEPAAESESDAEHPDRTYKSIPISSLNLSVRALHALTREHINTLDELIAKADRIGGFYAIGEKALNEIHEAINRAVTSFENGTDTQVQVPESESNLADELLDRSVDDMHFPDRLRNAMHRAGVTTIRKMLRLSEQDVAAMKGIGQTAVQEFNRQVALLKEQGVNYFEKEVAADNIKETEEAPAGKGLDYDLIDTLCNSYGFSAGLMTSWFGVSKQNIYDKLQRRSKRAMTKWTGKSLTESDWEIIRWMAKNKKLVYYDGNIIGYCLNNKRDDLAMVFVYENDIKCFFLKDLDEPLQKILIEANLHKYTARELAGESDGKIVYSMRQPYFQPDSLYRFRLNAQQRQMDSDEYAVFISGYHMLSPNATTDDRIIAFLKENEKDGVVHLTRDPSNQWFRTLAYRNKYSIEEFVELYGFQYSSKRTMADIDENVRAKYREALKEYIVSDRTVFLPLSSQLYLSLSRYAASKGMNVTEYIESLGYERVTSYPDLPTEQPADMEVREGNERTIEGIFALYPLLGRKVMSPGGLEKLIQAARKCVNWVLADSDRELSLKHKMLLTFTVINIAKEWKNEEAGGFWSYITLQLGHRSEENGRVVSCIKDAVEDSMKKNNRLFIMDNREREYKSTIVVHAMTTQKSWMALCDFLHDFYLNNLHANVVPNDPLFKIMIQALQLKLDRFGTDKSEELVISSKAYSFQEGIRKLIFLRPDYACSLFERMVGKIDLLVRNNNRDVDTYDDYLCVLWYSEKMRAAASRSREKLGLKNEVGERRDIAFVYNDIAVKYKLVNSNRMELCIPDIRLQRSNIEQAEITVYLGETVVCTQNAWYGNELGRTLIGVSLPVPAIAEGSTQACFRVTVTCESEIVYDSEKSLFRDYWFFSGDMECRISRLTRAGYTVVVPNGSILGTENTEVTEAESFMNVGYEAYYVELKDGFAVMVNRKPAALDTESGADIRVVMPNESASLPYFRVSDEERKFAYRKSRVSIWLSRNNLMERYAFLCNGERTDPVKEQTDQNGTVLSIPLRDAESPCHIQIINMERGRPEFDQTFLLADTAEYQFNRACYYSKQDYEGAVCRIIIDSFKETVPVYCGDSEVQVPYQNGDIIIPVPLVQVQETTGKWLGGTVSDWYIGSIPQDSQLKIIKPSETKVELLIGNRGYVFDKAKPFDIGNILQSLAVNSDTEYVDVELRIDYSQKYPLAHVYYKECFLRPPEIVSEGNKLFWDQGGRFIGKPGREFILTLQSGKAESMQFSMDEDTEYIELPEDIPVGPYSYQVSIQTGMLFRSTMEVLTEGECTIGDPNLLRFYNKKIVISAITDGDSLKETAHIPIRPCYIEQIRYLDMEDTSEGMCHVYTGVMYTEGFRGERYEFASSVYTNSKGKTKSIVNPVRIIYIGNSVLCVTDPDGDGLYYFTNAKGENAITDHEYTKASWNMHSVDLCIYHTERIKNVQPD